MTDYVPGENVDDVTSQPLIVMVISHYVASYSFDSRGKNRSNGVYIYGFAELYVLISRLSVFGKYGTIAMGLDMGHTLGITLTLPLWIFLCLLIATRGR